MNIYVTGVNHRIAPLEVREKLSFNGEEHVQALQAISALPGVEECVLISTCNRTEVYIHSLEENFENEILENTLCRLKALDLYGFKKYFYTYQGQKAVKHLFKVAGGLDSMVLGEDQILGQVKSAHEAAMDTKTSAVVMNTLFREAVTTAKKIKTSTEISKNSVSVASLAVKVVGDLFGNDFENKNTLIIGTGKIGSVVLKNLGDKGLRKIYATSRNHGRGSGAKEDNTCVEYVNYNDRYQVMDECDIIISSTSSPHYTITRDMLEKALRSAKKRVFIDLAVPRDIDADIRNLSGISYLNMDDLQAEAGRNIDRRVVEAKKAEEMVNESVAEFEHWYEFRKVLPVIKDIQSFADGILEEKVSQTLAKLKNATEEDKEVIRASMTNTVNEILNKFVYSIRECSDKEDMQTYFRCLGNAVRTE
ncbi:MAG: glutamyl-tRNA reductase [Clostridia bacterium]|nr:glutamyl-tRNA reductase [Clostridia bacterium]